jgi:amidase
MLFRGVRDLVGEVERPQRLELRTRHFARPGALVSDRMLERLLVAQREMTARVERVFDTYDVLLTPVMSETAAPAGVMEGRGAAVTYFWESSWVPFTILWNITGQPAASVPAGRSSEGLPLAVQLVGRPRDERTILSLAAQIEAERPWGEERPPVA